ncbi:hypothetical protein F442_01999 [Phytophthora nicotianae P10297]|uniref:DDE Tnp4 domain-containing protein n=1 Tax=Phytophthora nicotianae P10297 TaxID=1317064 RepID=W3A0J3_PHYNI|nr:hypothetical protein F442_01999 [Phytophthora nicotianae P10297]
MTGEDSDVLLVLADAFRRQSDGLRREVFRLLVEETRRVAMRSRHYLTTQCLDTPNESAWVILYKYGTDINFLNATSLTRIAFGNLLRRFVGFYYIPRLQPRGRPFKLRFHHQVLGLVLCYYTGSMELGTLCMLFGVPPITLARTLKREEEALTKALINFRPTRISWPSPTRQVELAKLIQEREPLLEHTFGFIDGKTSR